MLYTGMTGKKQHLTIIAVDGLAMKARNDMTKQFLSLEDAVLVAEREFDIDPEIARIEFEQKCYVTDNQYTIGYYDGLADAIEAIREFAESEE